MEESQRFSIEPSSDERNGPRSELLVEGRHTGVHLDGKVLEKQFRVHQGHYLLLLTDGSPYEEALHVYLVGESGEILETAEVGGAYAPGLLENVRVEGADRLRFGFQGERELLVHERPQGLLRRRRLEIRKVETA